MAEQHAAGTLRRVPLHSGWEPLFGNAELGLTGGWHVHVVS